MQFGLFWQGCAGRPFFLRGGARVKIRGAGRALAKKRVNRLIPKILQNCVNEKNNITYYNNNYKIYHNIIILAENKYCIHNRDYDHLFLIIILE